ncbi:MAG: hypothetical protein Ta2B_04600 [Termitinemataceae bacterium]|nr:MAG: hypothetical protein Ta2B_04600 [Termitinemataceae bacterium]
MLDNISNIRISTDLSTSSTTSAFLIDDLCKKLKTDISVIRIANTNAAAFSRRIIRGTYAVFINKKIEKKAFDILLLREKAHIVFNHLIYGKMQKEIFKNTFEKYFNRNKSAILMRLPDDKNINQKIGSFSNYIYKRFEGIAKSMEVNSRIFGANFEEVKNILDADLSLNILFKEELLAFPKAGWTLGADWLTYMYMLCANMKNSLDDIGNKDGKKIKSGDLSAYNNYSSENEHIANDYKSRAAIVQETNDNSMAIKIGRTSHLSGADSVCAVSVCDSMADLLNILKQKSYNEERRKLYTDVMYNTNRNKYMASLNTSGTQDCVEFCCRLKMKTAESNTSLNCNHQLSDVIIPRRRFITKRVPSNICILLDVSGSIPKGFIKKVIKTIISSEGVFNKRKSRLICWADYLCADLDLNSLEKIQTGGGTLLFEGIDYCKKYLCEDSHFFLISDFQDDLEQWIKSAKIIDAKKTAIGYYSGKVKKTFYEWFCGIGSNSDSHRVQTSIKEFSSVFDTVFLHV